MKYFDTIKIASKLLLTHMKTAQVYNNLLQRVWKAFVMKLTVKCQNSRGRGLDEGVKFLTLQLIMM